MDLGLFFRVLYRQKVLLVAGLVAGVVIGTFVAYKPTSKGLAPRALQYTSSAHLLVTDGPAEPFSSSTAQAAPSANAQVKPNFAPGDLADIYAQIIMSDQITNQVASVYGKLSAHNASVTAFRILAQSPNGFGVSRPRPLPLIEIDATADTPRNARVLAQLTSDAFQRYVNAQQNSAKLAVAQRTTVTEVLAPKAGSRSSSNPLVLLLLIAIGLFIAAIAAAGVRDNLQRRNAHRIHRRSEVDDAGDGPRGNVGPSERSPTSRPAAVTARDPQTTIGARR